MGEIKRRASRAWGILLRMTARRQEGATSGLPSRRSQRDIGRNRDPGGRQSPPTRPTHNLLITTGYDSHRRHYGQPGRPRPSPPSVEQTRPARQAPFMPSDTTLLRRRQHAPLPHPRGIPPPCLGATARRQAARATTGAKAETPLPKPRSLPRLCLRDLL